MKYKESRLDITYGFSFGSRVLMAASFAALLTATPVRGQWTSDTSANTVVCGATGDQVQPKIRNAKDGGSYVSWFDNRIGGYDVYLQRLDADGNALWAPDGVLILDRMLSSTTDYGLAVDS